MKLMVAIISRQDADKCTNALIKAGFVCTRLDSAGGFLDHDNTTLLIGVAAQSVDEVITILRRCVKSRAETMELAPAGVGSVIPGAVPEMEVEISGATVFVVDVEKFERL